MASNTSLEERMAAVEAAIAELQKLPSSMSLTNIFKTVGNGIPYLASQGIAKTILNFLTTRQLHKELSFNKKLERDLI